MGSLRISALWGNKEALAVRSEHLRQTGHRVSHRLAATLRSVAALGMLDMLQFLENHIGDDRELRLDCLREAVSYRRLDCVQGAPEVMAAALGHYWREGRAPILKALLESGLGPNATSLGTNRTPFQYAVEMGDEDSARLLVQYGADVNATIPQSKGKNHTPLFLAVQRRQISLIRLLLENGAHRTYWWKGKRFQVHTDARIHHVQRALGELGLAVKGEYYILLDTDL
ncbi:ankyrin [Penicillium alfredii]|uniref:Ankyrin n=1 Tax=Penicillium alfredii TaxID=1506179 RepID=A0A9W9KCV8_9EURO|nr:ankyrin [Penicillium alfredii]KAJ5101699.1 ankyrin [Penicillium alfredii]